MHGKYVLLRNEQENQNRKKYTNFLNILEKKIKTESHVFIRGISKL